MNTKMVVNLESLKELSRKYPDASVSARVSRITEALLLLEGAIKKETPVGAGPLHLRDTIFQKVSAGRQVRGTLGTPLQHGLPVEKGTRPHFPPVAPIQHWVERKLGITGKEAKSAAFLIARAISRRGTKGAQMFEKGFNMNEDRVIAILKQIPDDIVRAVSA